MMDTAPPSPRGSGVLLSRYAESMLWLARYMERIENLARLIDVTETFVRTGNTASGWRSIIEINADAERFSKANTEITARTVIDFYVTDRTNSNSIVSIAHAARENARALRPLISTEMWQQLNIFTNFIRELTPERVQPAQISALCSRIKQDCQTHAGITEGTLYRDQAWIFNSIGRSLERADQVTRLIDIKYHTLLPGAAEIGSPVDISQWTAVLRSAAGYHAFRRLLPRDLSPAMVSGFLLKNDAFPRSLTTSLRQLHDALSNLRTYYGLRVISPTLERVEQIRAILLNQTINEIIIRGLHEFMDWIQLELQAVQSEIARAFWPPPEEAPASVTHTQTQHQTSSQA